MSSASWPSATASASGSGFRTSQSSLSASPSNSSLRSGVQFWITEMVNVSSFAVSVLLARSTDRYSIRYSPGSERLNGALYSCHAPPLMRYSVRATPVPASVALRVTVTGLVPVRVGRRGRRGRHRRRVVGLGDDVERDAGGVRAAVGVGDGQLGGVRARRREAGASGPPRSRSRRRRTSTRRTRRPTRPSRRPPRGPRSGTRAARCRGSRARRRSRSARSRRSGRRGRTRRRPARRARRPARTSSPCTRRPSRAPRAGCRRRSAGRRPGRFRIQQQGVLDARAAAVVHEPAAVPVLGPAARVVRGRLVVAVDRAVHHGQALVDHVRAQLGRRRAVVRRVRRGALARELGAAVAAVRVAAAPPQVGVALRARVHARARLVWELDQAGVVGRVVAQVVAVVEAGRVPPGPPGT